MIPSTTTSEMSDISPQFRGEPTTYSPKVLIVEDDLSLRPLWTQALEKVAPNAQIQWALTEEAAERAIRGRAQFGEKFDVVIADIFLSGRRTGIDLWKRYGVKGSEFILVTAAAPSMFTHLLEDSVHKPECLFKPLKFEECVAACARLLAKPKGEEGEEL